MSTTDAQAIIDNAIAGTGPVEIDPEKYYAAPVPADGHVKIIEPVADADRLNPRRPSGTTTAYDVESLRLLWAKHAEETSELYADPVGFAFTGVLNADSGVGLLPGHRDHRVVLALRKTVAWKAWTAIDGQMLEQMAFADFIEERLVDVAKPTGAEMLELAQSIESTSSVDFKSAQSLATGARTLRYEEKESARAGQTGQLEIPKEITLGLRPFEDGDSFAVKARFRYRIRNGHLTLGVKLDRPEDVLKAAFDDFVSKVGAATETPVLLGAAPPAR